VNIEGEQYFCSRARFLVLLRKYCSRQDYRKQEPPIVNISDFALGAIFASSLDGKPAKIDPNAREANKKKSEYRGFEKNRSTAVLRRTGVPRLLEEPEYRGYESRIRRS
jgi:hypothetical protein